MAEHIVYVGGPKRPNPEKGESGRRTIAAPYSTIVVAKDHSGRYERTGQGRDGHTAYWWRSQ